MQVSGNNSESLVPGNDRLSDKSTPESPGQSPARFRRAGKGGSGADSDCPRLDRSETGLVDTRDKPYPDNEGVDTGGDNQSPWLMVGKKGRSHHESSAKVKDGCIQHLLSDEVVEDYLMETRNIRFELNDRFLNLGYSEKEYKELMEFIDQQKKACKNPVVKSHFIQNKEWLLRMQSINPGMMVVKSRKSGESVIRIKTEINCKILEIARAQIANLYKKF